MLAHHKEKSYFTSDLLTINYLTNLFHIHDTADTVTLLHLLEGSVDVGEWLAVGDELINL